MGNVYKYNLERPFGPEALSAEYMDNICKYTKYEQFGIIVIDFLDRDVIACYTKETGVILLYKTKQSLVKALGAETKQDNYSKKTFPNGYLGKYKIIYYKPSYNTDGILMSTSCFGIPCRH